MPVVEKDAFYMLLQTLLFMMKGNSMDITEVFPTSVFTIMKYIKYEEQAPKLGVTGELEFCDKNGNIYFSGNVFS
jgi:hypothetical protein